MEIEVVKVWVDNAYVNIVYLWCQETFSGTPKRNRNR